MPTELNAVTIAPVTLSAVELQPVLLGPQSGGAPGGGGGFSPDSVAGLMVWLNAEDLLGTYVNNDPIITPWLDASGEGHDATPVDSPLFKENVINGLPAVSIESGTQHFVVADHADIKLNTDLTIFLLVKQTVITGSRPFVSKTPTASGGALYYYATGSSPNKPIVDRPFVQGGTVATVALGMTAFHLASLRIAGTTLEHRLDAVANGGETMATGVATTDELKFGRFANSSTYGAHIFAEILVYNVALSDVDRDAVESYLMTRYAL